MGWVTGLATYMILWWLVIFMVLPWGNRAVDEVDVARGHAHGAPQKPRLGIKLAITTVIAGILWAIADLIVIQGWISFRS